MTREHALHTVLVVHNHYQQPGGEDQVFEAESRLLAARGHAVVRFTAHNAAVEGMGRLELASATVFNDAMYAQVREVIRRERPDVMHVHNTFPLISPAVYAAARDEGVPVVQTLHNYRLVCAGATLFRHGAPCEECLDHHSMWPAVLHRCYRDSLPATAATVRMLRHHHRHGTWATQVDRFLAMSEFAKSRFVAGGLPAEKIAVSANFIDDPLGGGAVPPRAADAPVLFAGRLSAEKGIATLLAAWAADASLPPLQLLGDGPLRDAVTSAAARDPRITWRGQVDAAAVRDAMLAASLLVLPSECHEGFPMVLVEAFACGLPVVQARVGEAPPLVRDGETGLTFAAGDAHALATAVLAVQRHAHLQRRLGAGARAEYEARLTPDAAYARLREAYAAATLAHRARTASA